MYSQAKLYFAAEFFSLSLSFFLTLLSIYNSHNLWLHISFYSCGLTVENHQEVLHFNRIRQTAIRSQKGNTEKQTSNYY